MATTVIARVAIHPWEGAIIPTPLPTIGNQFDPTVLQQAGWFTLGSIQNGDDGDISGEPVVPKPFRDMVRIKAPGAQTTQGIILRSSGIEEVIFGAYDISEGVTLLDSTMAETSEDSGEYERQGSFVYRSLLVEYHGKYIDLYPRVFLSITDNEAGYGPGDDAAATTVFSALVVDYPGYNSGTHRKYLQTAAS